MANQFDDLVKILDVKRTRMEQDIASITQEIERLKSEIEASYRDEQAMSTRVHSGGITPDNPVQTMLALNRWKAMLKKKRSALHEDILSCMAKLTPLQNDLRKILVKRDFIVAQKHSQDRLDAQKLMDTQSQDRLGMWVNSRMYGTR